MGVINLESGSTVLLQKILACPRAQVSRRLRYLDRRRNAGAVCGGQKRCGGGGDGHNPDLL